MGRGNGGRERGMIYRRNKWEGAREGKGIGSR